MSDKKCTYSHDGKFIYKEGRKFIRSKCNLGNPWVAIETTDDLLAQDCPGCDMKKAVCLSVIFCFRSAALKRRKIYGAPQFQSGDIVKVLSSRDAFLGEVVAKVINGTAYGDVSVVVIDSGYSPETYPVGKDLSIYAHDLIKVDHFEARKWQ